MSKEQGSTEETKETEKIKEVSGGSGGSTPCYARFDLDVTAISSTSNFGRHIFECDSCNNSASCCRRSFFFLFFHARVTSREDYERFSE
jgi:hypothetical protein